MSSEGIRVVLRFLLQNIANLSFINGHVASAHVVFCEIATDNVDLKKMEKFVRGDFS